MKILVVGSGGREHALSWALARSEGVSEVAVSPGNAGTEWSAGEGVACCYRLNGDPVELAGGFDLVVVGPEAPLVEGLADKLNGTPVFGPSARAAMIEASKDYAKKIMERKGVPTARHKMVESVEDLGVFGTPVVVKDDGLAAGKGVGVFESLDEAVEFYHDLKNRCERIFVEEYLEGPELSVLAFCDGKNFSVMPPARDYKRRFENDQGPNTGGMGAISPVTDQSRHRSSPGSFGTGLLGRYRACFGGVGRRRRALRGSAVRRSQADSVRAQGSGVQLSLRRSGDPGHSAPVPRQSR